MKRLFVILILGFLGFILAGCKLSEDKTFVVGLECNYPPFNWTDVKANEFTEPISNSVGYADGYDVVMARRIADELGYNLIIMQFNWEGLITALNTGMIDAIIAGMSPTAERKEVIDFTAPYYISEQSIVVRADSEFADAAILNDFTGAKIVAQVGTLQVDLIPQIPNVVELTPRDSYPDCLLSLTSGEADGIIAETPVAQSFLKGTENLKIVSFAAGKGFSVTEDQVAVSVGLRKGDERLNAINEVLAKIALETRNEWMTAALNRKAAIDSELE